MSIYNSDLAKVDRMVEQMHDRQLREYLDGLTEARRRREEEDCYECEN